MKAIDGSFDAINQYLGSRGTVNVTFSLPTHPTPLLSAPHVAETRRVKATVLAHVVLMPKRLQVAPVEALVLLILVVEVKASTWPAVVNVPPTAAVRLRAHTVPGHAVCKLALEMPV